MQAGARSGGLIAGWSGIALIVIMVVFDWYTIEEIDFGLDAFLAYGDVFNLLLLAAAVAAICAMVVGAQGGGSGLPVSLSTIATALGALSALYVLVRVFATPDFEPGAVDAGVGTTVGAGAILGLIACAGIAVGGWLAMRAEGSSFRAPGGGLPAEGGADPHRSSSGPAA